MTVVRVTLRTPRGELAHWGFLIGISLALHVAAGVAIIFLPMVLRPKLKFPQVYTVDLMSLPAGAPGPKAGPPEAPPAPNPAPAAAKAAPPISKPAPKPVVKAPPPAPKPKAAIKIPEKPTEKTTKPKPAEKAKETAKPVPEPESTAAAEEKAEGTSKESATKGSEGAPSGAQAPIAGLSNAPGAGEGAAGAGGGGAGGMLDDATFQYGWYLSNMSGLFSRNWTRPIKPDLSTSLRAIVHFRIQKDGKITDIVLEQPSGDAALDRSALRAVQDSNPLPPLPYQYAKDSLGVHFFFDLVPD
ncbi:MAG TPA: TonB family protein [Candidatus Polarisedimenticolia bacterium]|nr:TonB family protein [Candidatus Polarisedimenticolia bacterium]